MHACVHTSTLTHKHIWRPSLTSCWYLLELTILFFHSGTLASSIEGSIRTIFTVTNHFCDIEVNKKNVINLVCRCLLRSILNTFPAFGRLHVLCSSCPLSMPTHLKNEFNKYAKPKNMHLVIGQGSPGSCEVFKPRATSKQAGHDKRDQNRMFNKSLVMKGGE